MVTTNTGRVKKVQFYAALALLLCGSAASAAELEIPIADVQQQLAEKVDAAVSRKLRDCRQEERTEKGSQPHYPVRIAGERSLSGGIAGMYAGIETPAF